MCTDHNGYPPPLLSGQHNFRDLGGIPSLRGGKVVRETLFRSGDLHSLTAQDIELLEDLHLAMIIDFRSPTERENRPNKIIRTVKHILHLPIHDAPRELASEYVQKNNPDGLKMLLVHEYSRIIRNYIPEYRQFFSVLMENPELPLVFQCSAGKDRTGLATIFLLTALDVDEEVILSDYYATNHYVQAHAEEIIGILNRKGHDGELMKPLLEVRPEYLRAALSEIGKKYHSISHFVRDELKVDFKILQDRFLRN